ncbi:PASTA domain-containing protein [Dactylosporangium sp. CA-092794]|uniref:PASTA domain-containing protein n=1 Tax=Dactylosporangium sp. CA-092794 TaxID=3239929 RepID=UPI003D94E719
MTMLSRVTVIFAALLLLAACGDGKTDRDIRPTEGAVTGAGVSSGAPDPSGPPSDGPAPTSHPSASSVAPDEVPNVVDMRLDQAEGILRGAGLLSINRADATGQNRTVLEPHNWIVRGQDPVAGTKITAGLTVTLKVGKSTDDLPTIEPTKGVVPDVRCRDLQTAQDALRGAGFYLLVPKDGLGGHRVPLVDRDWIVVGQSVAPGTQAGYKTTITLTVVKIGEPAGASGCQT